MYFVNPVVQYISSCNYLIEAAFLFARSGKVNSSAHSYRIPQSIAIFHLSLQLVSLIPITLNIGLFELTLR